MSCRCQYILLFCGVVILSAVLIWWKTVRTCREEKAGGNASSTNVLIFPDKGGTEEEIPFIELISNEKVESYISESRYVHRPAVIEPEKTVRNEQRTFIRPEDSGEDFTGYSSEQLLDKLQSGDKIEQRKAANILWDRYGSAPERLDKDDRRLLANCIQRYLLRIPSDFEENFMQLQRLWHLAAPALLDNVPHPETSVSENASRLLSVMKTRQIIDQLVAASDNAASALEARKYVFALEYMKINNPVFLENRRRMTDQECERAYNELVVPQINVLKQRFPSL